MVGFSKGGVGREDIAGSGVGVCVHVGCVCVSVCACYVWVCVCVCVCVCVSLAHLNDAVRTPGCREWLVVGACLFIVARLTMTFAAFSVGTNST